MHRLLLVQYAKKYAMVIVSPILERDHEFSEVIWNTAGKWSNLTFTPRICSRHRPEWGILGEVEKESHSESW